MLAIQVAPLVSGSCPERNIIQVITGVISTDSVVTVLVIIFQIFRNIYILAGFTVGEQQNIGFCTLDVRIGIGRRAQLRIAKVIGVVISADLIIIATVERRILAEISDHLISGFRQRGPVIGPHLIELRHHGVDIIKTDIGHHSPAVLIFLTGTGLQAFAIIIESQAKAGIGGKIMQQACRRLVSLVNNHPVRPTNSLIGNNFQIDLGDLQA